ncbi:MAG: M20 family metallopeptidase [Candidatus Nanohaloarchaea archaeon]
MNNLAERLSQHVSTESVFPDEREYAEFLEQQLRDRGFDTQRQRVEEDRFNILASRGEGETTVMFYGHTDTVPAYSGWSYDPFDPEVNDGRLYGRGAVDMKAGNLAILEAINDVPDNVEIMVAFGVDEEYMSRGSSELVESGFMEDVDIVLVPEPGTRESMNQIIMGRRGRITVEVTVRGESAHAATPSEGESALLDASRLALELQELELHEDPEMGSGELTIRSFESDAGSLSIPEESELVIDRHMVPGETTEDCLAQIEEVADRMRIDCEIRLRDRPTDYLLPYRTEPEGLAEVFRGRLEALVDEPETVYGRSVADENRLSETEVPVVTYGPIGGNEHTADEWVDLESLETLIEVYRDFLRDLSENRGEEE